MKKTIFRKVYMSLLVQSLASANGQFNDQTKDSEMSYGDGTNSSIGRQNQLFYYDSKVLRELPKAQIFGQLSNTRYQPKNMGKKIKIDLMVPLLDDRNVNDQGIDATGASITDGNLFGSSKDIGKITAKLPAISEHGGRVNRVGYRRITLESSLDKFGFFSEYSAESMNFDTDAQLEMHIREEAVKGANEMMEAQLQIDILNSAGVVRYGGSALQNGEITGESGSIISLPTYDGLMKMDITLDRAKCPKSTKVIYGSRLEDTRVIEAARYMYVGSELLPTLDRMKNNHGEKAFVSAIHYGSAGNLASEEKGSVGGFRIIVAPEMLHWAGAGGTATSNNSGYRETGGRYDIFPMLAVGSGSFSHIGFQTDGKSTKWTIIHKKPNAERADSNDPFGETGFYSIKWYYGFMAIRPEWIGVYKVVAEI